MRGVYIHIPFCRQKCNYCDFCSYPSLLSRQDEYCEALCREAESCFSHGIKVDTIYFGGGTPSLFSAQNLSRVLHSLSKSFDISANAEITLEANPCTVTDQTAQSYRSIGFNRISLGAQSFVDSELETLGRLHTKRDTETAFCALRKAGFSNISLDLMYALPGQTIKSLGASVNRAIELSPEHISCYGLKIEEGTPFYDMLTSGEISEKSEDEYADMYDYISRILPEAGYSQYELSNFSKKGFESRHNLKYWTAGEYIGMGAAAASYYKGKRYTHSPDFDEYISSFKNSEFCTLSADEMMSEFMFLSLRLTSIGASKAEFERRFSRSIEDVFADAVSKHLKLGTILDMGDRYVLSPKAYFISNSVLCDFV